MKKLLIPLMLLAFVPAYADVNVEIPTETSACDGSTTTFPFDFSIQEITDVYAFITEISSSDETDIVQDVNYTVSAVNNDYTNGGLVTTIDTYPATHTITIARHTPRSQLAVLADTEVLRLAALETSYDKLTRIVQELTAILGRTYQLPRGSTDGPVYTEDFDPNDFVYPTVDETKHYAFTVWDVNSVWSDDTQICIDPNTSGSITITEVEITLDADPTTELNWNLKWADAFIGLANATLIVACDTTAGVADIDSGFNDATVPAGKCIYMEFDAGPDEDTTQASVKVTWTYD